jgi:hypothetical protein
MPATTVGAQKQSSIKVEKNGIEEHNTLQILTEEKFMCPLKYLKTVLRW